MSLAISSEASAFRATTDIYRHTAERGARQAKPVRPVAPVERARGDGSRQREAVVIDIRPDAVKETDAAKAARRDTAEASAQATTAETKTAEAGVVVDIRPVVGRANADTPFRQRSDEQHYQVAEALDLKVPHRGSVFDLSI